jgi:hypothetical protein
MGIIIEFPMSRRMAQDSRRGSMEGSAEIVILPVIRIERTKDKQARIRSRATVRKRRRRAQRS